MPTIITGEAGNNGVGDFIAALQAGRGDALAAKEAKRREEMYQQDIRLAQMQIESQEAERELGGLWAQGMAGQQELGQAKAGLPATQGAAQAVGGPMGALLKMRNEGVGEAPEEQVTLSYLMNRFPQGLELMGRLTGDSRRRFVHDVTQTAALQMEAEQLQEGLARAEALGLDLSMFEGKDSAYVNGKVDEFYNQESALQTRRRKFAAEVEAVSSVFQALGDALPEEFHVRLNALRNEMARRPDGNYENKLNQIESSAEIAMGITEGSLRTALKLFQDTVGGMGMGGSSKAPSAAPSQPQAQGAPQTPTSTQSPAQGQPGPSKAEGQPEPTSGEGGPEFAPDYDAVARNIEALVLGGATDEQIQAAVADSGASPDDPELVRSLRKYGERDPDASDRAKRRRAGGGSALADGMDDVKDIVAQAPKEVAGMVKDAAVGAVKATEEGTVKAALGALNALYGDGPSDGSTGRTFDHTKSFQQRSFQDDLRAGKPAAWALLGVEIPKTEIERVVIIDSLFGKGE